VVVCAAWIGSAIVAPILWRRGARRLSEPAAQYLAVAAAVVMLQAVAAVSQDLN
jgi:hypothetical protein